MVNICYYQSVFDRSWAEATLAIENEFWDTLAILFSNGGPSLDEKFDANFPLVSKKVNEGQVEIGRLVRSVDETWMDQRNTERQKRRLVGLL